MFENQSKPLSVILVDGLSSKENSRKAFYHWRACIHSGVKIRIVIAEGHPVSMGFCRHKLKNRYIDFEIECEGCKKHKKTRTPPKHVRTPIRKVRIGTARRRSMARRKEHFEFTWKKPPKH